MIPPIRLSLLSHAVSYKRLNTDDGWDKTFDEPVEIKRVRVQMTKKLVQTESGYKWHGIATLFHDTKYSTPVEFVRGSKIIFDGQEMTIQDISSYYDDKRLHHLEIGLI